jgi:hypothetical protein
MWDKSAVTTDTVHCRRRQSVQELIENRDTRHWPVYILKGAKQNGHSPPIQTNREAIQHKHWLPNVRKLKEPFPLCAYPYPVYGLPYHIRTFITQLHQKQLAVWPLAQLAPSLVALT